MADVAVNVVNYNHPDQSLLRERKNQDPEWRAQVRNKIYERVSWNKDWQDEPERRDPDAPGPPEQTFEQVFQKRVEKSVIGQFLEDSRIPANREVREAMIEILEYDWKSFTQKQWKKFAAKNNFISNPIANLARAVLRNEPINCQWLEAIATALRLIASGITKIGKSLKRFKLLHHLSLGGNQIKEIDGEDLPPDLRVLELAGNRISSLNRLLNNAPKGLIFIGLSRNCISNEMELLSLAENLNSLKVLDLEDNDLKNLNEVLEALKPLDKLRALILEGNPCSTCLSYKSALLATFPKLIYLDNVVVKPSDKLDEEWTQEPEKLSTGIFFIHIYRIFHLAQPPKLKNEKFWYFFEVDLPLLDSRLLLQEEMEMVREQFAKTGVDFPVLVDDRLPKEKARDDKKNRVTAFRTEEFEWKESLTFNDPALKMPPYGDELKLLSDTFKSIVTVRLVRQKFPIDYKKGSQSQLNIEVKERTILCEFKCALRNMSWADRSQDFSWSSELAEGEPATPFAAGVLARQTYIRHDHVLKSSKSLQKQRSLLRSGSKIFEPVALPKNFTIHIGFGLQRFPDFDPIEILPVKGKK